MSAKTAEFKRDHGRMSQVRVNKIAVTDIKRMIARIPLSLCAD